MIARNYQRLGRSPLADVRALLASYRRALRAEGRSERTLRNYEQGIEAFARWLEAEGLPTDVEHLTARDLRDHIGTLLESKSASTAAARYRQLHTFFRWLVDEGELETSPMDRLRAPKVPEKPVPILTDDELKRLIAACKGNNFTARRDLAIIRLLHSTGLRLGELANLRVTDVDLDENVLIVLKSKGGKPRLVPFTDKTARALDRYLRVRSSHPDAEQPWLWLSRFGVLNDAGIRDALYRRAKQAGVEGFHPHRLRHQFAHEFLAAGGQELDLMELAGWRSRQMLGRYGAAKRTERAVAAYRRLAASDRF